ncbi:hypothetical protein [Naasia aerilata]|uniref:hypothetical protein n=1 Tax=Naasia aerilata TaxID=1162966 RepID=UPI0033056074
MAGLLGPRWALGVGASAGFLAAIVGVAWFLASHRVHVRRHPGVRWGVTVSADPAERPDLAARLLPSGR